MPTKNRQSNAYPTGGNIFEIKGLSANEALAVEDDGQYRVFTPIEGLITKSKETF